MPDQVGSSAQPANADELRRALRWVIEHKSCSGFPICWAAADERLRETTVETWGGDPWPVSDVNAMMQVPAAHHLGIMCLICKDGYGGTDLRGAERWITQHIHPDPEDDE